MSNRKKEQSFEPLTYGRNIGHFKTTLEQLSGQKCPVHKWMMVTPEMASIMLQHNKPQNRKISSIRVAKWVSELEAANWVVTGQGLTFDTDGHLVDGH